MPMGPSPFVQGYRCEKRSTSHFPGSLKRAVLMLRLPLRRREWSCPQWRTTARMTSAMSPIGTARVIARPNGLARLNVTPLEGFGLGTRTRLSRGL
jgi:hypothetical protein